MAIDSKQWKQIQNLKYNEDNDNIPSPVSCMFQLKLIFQRTLDDRIFNLEEKYE